MSSSIAVGDHVRIVGKSRHNGKTGVVSRIRPDKPLPVEVQIGRGLYFFSYQEVVKI